MARCDLASPAGVNGGSLRGSSFRPRASANGLNASRGVGFPGTSVALPARSARTPDPSFFPAAPSEANATSPLPTGDARDAPRDTPTTAATASVAHATSAALSEGATPRARTPDAAESAAAARVRPAPSRGILSTADVDADAGATATGAAEALASRMDPPSASIASVTPTTTPSRSIVACHAPRAPIAMDAPRRFAGCCSAGVERKWTTKNEWFQSPFKNAFRNPFREN